MSYEQSALQLMRLGEYMVREAELGNWPRVSQLHQRLHGKLLKIFEGDDSGGDNDNDSDLRTFQLLSHLQQINEQVADAASKDHRECYSSLSRLRQNQNARQSYTAVC